METSETQKNKSIVGLLTNLMVVLNETFKREGTNRRGHWRTFKQTKLYIYSEIQLDSLGNAC